MNPALVRVQDLAAAGHAHVVMVPSGIDTPCQTHNCMLHWLPLKLLLLDAGSGLATLDEQLGGM